MNIKVSVSKSFNLHVSMFQCGVSREEDGAVSAVVVVQHHPVIQRRGDKVETAAASNRYPLEPSTKFREMFSKK